MPAPRTVAPMAWQDMGTSPVVGCAFCRKPVPRQVPTPKVVTSLTLAVRGEDIVVIDSVMVSVCGTCTPVTEITLTPQP